MKTNLSRLPLTAQQAALLGLVQSYLSGMMDVGVSLLEIRKLMYFLQVAGEPLGINYQVAINGLDDENLRNILGNLENYFILGLCEAEDDPTMHLELAEGAGEEGLSFLQNYPKTRKRFGEVSHLIEGFESPYGLELLATVHWVANRQGAKSLDLAVEKVHAWSQRKLMFTPHQIQAAWDRLQGLGWLDGRPHADGHLGKGP